MSYSQHVSKAKRILADVDQAVTNAPDRPIDTEIATAFNLNLIRDLKRAELHLKLAEMEKL